MVMYTLKFDNQALMATTSVLFESDYRDIYRLYSHYYEWKKIMMANTCTVSQYLYGLTFSSQYLGITVWTVYCPLLLHT